MTSHRNHHQRAAIVSSVSVGLPQGSPRIAQLLIEWRRAELAKHAAEPGESFATCVTKCKKALGQLRAAALATGVVLAAEVVT